MRLTAAALALGLLAAPLTSRAQAESNWYAQLTLANDRVRHGVSQVYTGDSIQFGIDYQHQSGFFVGASVANAEYATDRFVGISRDEQVDLYAGFTWDLADWLINARVGHYVYPDIAIDYDYTDWSLGIVYRNRFLASVNYTDDLLALWGSALDYEIGIAWPVPGDFELGGSVGRFRATQFFNTEYTHWNIGLSRSFRRFGFDARYHDSSATRPTPLGSPVNESWILSVSVTLKR